jgi:hypothetical protein
MVSLLENLTHIRTSFAIENLVLKKRFIQIKKVYATLSESVPLIQDGFWQAQLSRNG